jgi:hypothetical protein
MVRTTISNASRLGSKSTSHMWHCTVTAHYDTKDSGSTTQAVAGDHGALYGVYMFFS